MIKMELTNYGAHVFQEGFISKEEMEQGYLLSVELLKKMPNPFGVFVDNKKAKTLSPECLVIQQKIQQLFATHPGFTRSAIVVGDPISKMQFTRASKEAGVYATLRYIDSTNVQDFEAIAQRWIVDGVDPDLA